MKKTIRAMWLLNHSTARKFEVSMLKNIGIDEIFLPKIIPQDFGFRSGNVDFSEDAHLNIPADELAILNATDWYQFPTRQAWEIANQYFDVLFFIVHKPELFENILRHFKGIIIWRIYGLDKSMSYSKIISDDINRHNSRWLIKRAGRRFWFGQAYAHLHQIENTLLSERALYLPLGLPDVTIKSGWVGTDKRLLFVCPEIELNSYYRETHLQFKQTFSDIPYVIAGVQALPTNDPHVTGYVPGPVYEQQMCELGAMYYHSSEPNHIHYHPFEAIKYGMPLVFMAGGILDRFGGIDLPGRCLSAFEAKQKVKRLLDGDQIFIQAVRSSQGKLLEPMRSDRCVKIWADAMQQALEDLQIQRRIDAAKAPKRPRIAVLMPVSNRRGSWQEARLLAEAISSGSQQAGQAADVVIGYIDDPDSEINRRGYDLHLPEQITYRPYRWRVLAKSLAEAALMVAKMPADLEEQYYQVPDDGMNNFLDCDVWLFISDRLEHRLLPIRPYLLFMNDYLQRYQPFLSTVASLLYIIAARYAECVITTTQFTQQDIMQCTGLTSDKVISLPMLIPTFSNESKSSGSDIKNYFLWNTSFLTNESSDLIMKALLLYYKRHEGQLRCHMVCMDTTHDKSTLLKSRLRKNEILKTNVKLYHELTDEDYYQLLPTSQFLFHREIVDNAPYVVVEAISKGVPVLLVDYPAIRELDTQFNLKLNWIDTEASQDPLYIAMQLKQMECKIMNQDICYSDIMEQSKLNIKEAGAIYWKTISESL